MLNFLFGNNNRPKNILLDPICIDIINKWKKLFSLLDIKIVESDRYGYDFMTVEIKHERHRYFKVHTICPWVTSYNDIKRIDDEGDTIETHLCNTLNIYPADSKYNVHILLGVQIYHKEHIFGYPKAISICQCSGCNRFVIYSSFRDVWNCKCSDSKYETLLSYGYLPDKYSKLISIINESGLAIENKGIFDMYYLPYTSSIILRDEKGPYIYVVSTHRTENNLKITIIHIGTAISPSSFLWNICDEHPDLKLDILLYKENAENIMKSLNTLFCAQDGWIIGKDVQWIIREILDRK